MHYSVTNEIIAAFSALRVLPGHIRASGL